MDEPTANGTANESLPDKAGSTESGHSKKRKQRTRDTLRYGLYLAASVSKGKGDDDDCRIPGAAYLDKVVRIYRCALEDAVLERYAAVSIERAGIIQQAARWAWVAEHAIYELRENYVSLKPAERAKLSYNSALALQNRDAAVRSLKLEGVHDPFSLPPLPDEQP